MRSDDVDGVLRIGLTGGIGSGKSTVAAMLVQEGAVLVDTDAIALELTQVGGAAIEALRQDFGARAIDESGALDRAHMRTLVFSEPGAKRRLEAILHPMIGVEAQRRAAAVRTGAVVFDVPLLAESSRWRVRVDRVLVVDCDETTQIERVMLRSKWTRSTAERVIGQQAPRVARRRCADAVIFNQNISLAELAAEVHALWGRWCPPPET
jgi:dephospho-CoA kinase